MTLRIREANIVKVAIINETYNLPVRFISKVQLCLNILVVSYIAITVELLTDTGVISDYKILRNIKQQCITAQLKK